MSFISRTTVILSKISLFFFPLLLQAQSQESYYQTKFEAYFSKDHEVKNFVSINENGISIYENGSAKEQGKKAEIKLSWREVDSLKNIISSISEKELEKILFDKKDSLFYYVQKDSLRHIATNQFNGMRIAIDPGHIGGTFEMGETESRCMKLGIDSTVCIQLEEGNFTFLTASLLKKKLDKEGAITMLTRPDTGISSLGISFYDWKRKIKNRAYVDSLVKEGLMTEKEAMEIRGHLPDKSLFSNVFGPMDLSERAKKVNAFKPDMTVIIHYNVNEKNTGWTKTTDKDFVMAFVSGCVTTKDLQTLAGRLNLLRLLISDDIENSVKLSSLVVNHLSADLKVPLAKKTDATYLSEHCLSTPAVGVYSRDLALARLIKGTLVYGEPLYQDNSKECMLLTGHGENIEGMTVPLRIQLVADAYYKAISDYVDGLKKK
ncbi:MAG TPA: N-acetylmuramoyl-L-alanine amidase [Bacteroidia bacterium]|jgi:N-acetylmuramoyl-L-alanine amidase|nr:N-acetylmuramoyl-L-alanine amidase [Bacteroidia bacterium]